MNLRRFVTTNAAFGTGLIFICFAIGLAVAGIAEKEPFLGASATLATAGAALLALGIYVGQDESGTSEFYLERSIEGLKKAYDLLRDNNNDRATWVLAARILARSRELSNLVSLESHRKFLNVEQDYYRLRFGEILKRGQANAAAFFLTGFKYDFPLNHVNEILEENRIELDGYLPEEVLFEVYRAAEYPDDYDEPIKGFFGRRHNSKLSAFYPSLYQYVTFLRSWKRPIFGHSHNQPYFGEITDIE